MCVKPTYFWVERGPKWEKMPKACGLCWRCGVNRVNDYVGRSMAEAAFSDWMCGLTLTYAPRDDLADKILTPSHFQQFIRALRRRDHKVRYLVAGEYGELRGRAHFHVLLFGKGKRPQMPNGKPWPQERRFHIDEWKHGHCWADWQGDERAVRYVCKYLTKNNPNDIWFSVSKKPTLGAEFFAAKAQLAVELGVLPSGFEYLPPGGSENRTYLMTGATRRDYMRAVVGGWKKKRPLDVSRLSEWVRIAYETDQRRQEKAWREALPIEEQLEGWAEGLDNRRMSEEQGDRIAQKMNFDWQELEMMRKEQDNGASWNS